MLPTPLRSLAASTACSLESVAARRTLAAGCSGRVTRRRSGPWHLAGKFGLAWLAIATAAPSFAAPDPIVVSCRVFEDTDSSGTYQSGEPLLSGMRITNGRNVSLTDAQGRVDLVVDRAEYRFATLTIPSGHWPTTVWAHWVPVGHDGPDSVDFGLRLRPETAHDVDSVRWVHITDTHVQSWEHPYRLDLDLREIDQITDSPLFVVNTGDLVHTARDTTHWSHYAADVATSSHVVFPVAGNHDILWPGPSLANYEHWAGPPYYSFEVGNWHFVVRSGDANNATSTTPAQDAWLAADLAAAPPGSHLAMFQHYTLQETDPARVAAWDAAGFLACFSGHWHSHQFTERPNGMRDFNLSWINNGGVDRTPRVFGFVTCTRDGEIRYEQRRLGVDHRVRIASPQPSQIVGREAVEVLVQAYDTTSPVTSLTATLSGLGGGQATAPLVAEGISLWRVLFDASSLPQGYYDVTVTGSFADGTPIFSTLQCLLSDVIPIVRAPTADWPMFRRCSAGSSFVSTSLNTPLEIAWSTAVPGMVGLSSPVVANGKVYLGCRAEREVGEAGVIACDATTGELSWFTHIPSGVALAPAVHGTTLVVTSMSDSVYALDTGTGARLWTVPQVQPRYTMTAPIFDGSVAWVGTEPRVMQVQESGVVEWTSELFGDPWYPVIYSAPAASAAYLYCGVFGWPNAATGGFRVIRRSDGAVVYGEGGCARSPLCTADALYVVGAADLADQVLTARELTGALRWTASKSLGAGTASPTIGHGVLVVPGRNGAIEGFRASDGANLWTKYVGPQLYDMEQGWGVVRSTPGTPAIADSVVYVGSLDGNLYALDLFTGDELWRWNLGVPIASSPAISGNMLFIAAEDEHLYGFVSIRGRTVRGPHTISRSAILYFAAHPNPSAGRTRFSWTMLQRSRVSMQILDVHGRLVRTLVDELREPGAQQTAWDGTDRSGSLVGAGVYWARLHVAEQTSVQKFVRLRP